MLLRIALALVARSGARIGIAAAFAIALHASVPAGAAQTLDAGTRIPVRLLDPVSSRPAMLGREVRALVIAPVPSDTSPLLTPGMILRGAITEAGQERHHKRRRFVAVEFIALETSPGHETPLSALVSSVDNAAERVDTTGRILGLPDPSLVRSKTDWALLVLGTAQPEAAATLFAADRGEMHERHRTIDFRPGVEMLLRLTDSVPLPDPPAWKEPPKLASTARMDSLLQSLPPRTYAFGGRKPADLINVVLIGSDTAVQAAFRAAGWELAERLDVRTGFTTFVDMARVRGYEHQPVSQLLLEGRPPDMVYQKLTDTFAKRHHIRIWRSDVKWEGRPVFVAAATHDVGIEFLGKQHTFTHRVDPRIDLERDKVVNDFVTAGLIEAISFALRVPIAGVTMNREKNPVVTDWRVAVASLRAPK
jgi:hypothetical protein